MDDIIKGIIEVNDLNYLEYYLEPEKLTQENLFNIKQLKGIISLKNMIKYARLLNTNIKIDDYLELNIITNIIADTYNAYKEEIKAIDGFDNSSVRQDAPVSQKIMILQNKYKAELKIKMKKHFNIVAFQIFVSIIYEFNEILTKYTNIYDSKPNADPLQSKFREIRDKNPGIFLTTQTEDKISINTNNLIRDFTVEGKMTPFGLFNSTNNNLNNELSLAKRSQYIKL